jgi:hypothetical protein
LSLTNQGKPYQLEVQAVAGDTKVSFAGTLVPFLLETVDGNLQLSGKDLSTLYPIVPLPLHGRPLIDCQTLRARGWRLVFQELP